MNRKTFYMLFLANLAIVVSAQAQTMVEMEGFCVLRGVEMTPEDESAFLGLFHGLPNSSTYYLKASGAEYGTMELSQVEMLIAATGGDIQANGVQEVVIIQQGCIYRHCGNTFTDATLNAELGFTDEMRAAVATLLAKYE